jgi:hypothetical protein
MDPLDLQDLQDLLAPLAQHQPYPGPLDLQDPQVKLVISDLQDLQGLQELLA